MAKYRNQAVLIFRNDEDAFSEKLESDSGERILSVSTGVGEEKSINTTQFETICKYILDVQGYVGTKSQTSSTLVLMILTMCGRNLSIEPLEKRTKINIFLFMAI